MMNAHETLVDKLTISLKWRLHICWDSNRLTKNVEVDVIFVQSDSAAEKVIGTIYLPVWDRRLPRTQRIKGRRHHVESTFDGKYSLSLPLQNNRHRPNDEGTLSVKRTSFEEWIERTKNVPSGSSGDVECFVYVRITYL